MGFRTLSTIGTFPATPENDEERLTVSIVRISGKTTNYDGIDLRRFWIDRDGGERPGRQGITLRSKAEATELLDLLRQALKDLPDDGDDAASSKKTAAKRPAAKKAAPKRATARR